MKDRNKISRRQLVTTGAIAAVAVAMPHIRRANAAGKISIGLWDHWVPGANDIQNAMIKEWSQKENVEVQVDYITLTGNKLQLTIAAEAMGKSGHDIMEFTNFEAVQQEGSLERVDDVMKAVLAANGPVDPSAEQVAKWGGNWIAVPVTRGSQLTAVCSRFDLLQEHAGIDVRAMY